MIFQYFNASNEDKFGKELASILVEYMSANKQGKSDKKISKKHDAVVNRLSNMIAGYRDEHKLNFYKKAKLANSFKWALLDSGFSNDFVNEITRVLVMQLRVKNN